MEVGAFEEIPLIPGKAVIPVLDSNNYAHSIDSDDAQDTSDCNYISTDPYMPYASMCKSYLAPKLPVNGNQAVAIDLESVMTPQLQKSHMTHNEEPRSSEKGFVIKLPSNAERRVDYDTVKYQDIMKISPNAKKLKEYASTYVSLQGRQELFSVKPSKDDCTPFLAEGDNGSPNDKLTEAASAIYLLNSEEERILNSRNKASAFSINKPNPSTSTTWTDIARSSCRTEKYPIEGFSTSPNSDQVLVEAMADGACGGTSDVTDVGITDSEDCNFSHCIDDSLVKKSLPVDRNSVSPDLVDVVSVTSDAETDVPIIQNIYMERSEPSSMLDELSSESGIAQNSAKLEGICSGLSPPPPLDSDELSSDSESVGSLSSLNSTFDSALKPDPLYPEDSSFNQSDISDLISRGGSKLMPSGDLRCGPHYSAGQLNRFEYDVDKSKSFSGFLCLLCRKSCSSIASAKVHFKTSHFNEEIPTSFPYQEVVCPSCRSEYLMCLYCGKRYFSVKKIIEHTRKHGRRESFVCMLCNRRKSSENKFHLYCHNDLSPFCMKCISCQENKKGNLSYEDCDNASQDLLSETESESSEPDISSVGYTNSSELYESDDSEEDVNYDPIVLVERLPSRVVKCKKAIVKLVSGKWELIIPCDASTGDLVSTTVAPGMEEEFPAFEATPDVMNESSESDVEEVWEQTLHSTVSDDEAVIIQESLHCEICEEEFSSPEILKSHIMNIHLNSDSDDSNSARKEIYTCNICSTKFDAQDDFVVHMKTHDGAIKFACVVCKAEFASEISFEKHLLVHGTNRESEKSKIPRYFRCRFCPFKTLNEAAKINHEDFECATKIFPCNVCNKRFVSYEKLCRHNAVHGLPVSRKTAEKSILPKENASQCKQKYHGNLVTSSSKERKRRKRGKQNPTKSWRRCEQCDKTFKKQCRYLMHIESRHGISISHPNKRYECHKCSERFAYIASLHVHIRKHYM